MNCHVFFVHTPQKCNLDSLDMLEIPSTAVFHVIMKDGVETELEAWIGAVSVFCSSGVAIF